MIRFLRRAGVIELMLSVLLLGALLGARALAQTAADAEPASVAATPAPEDFDFFSDAPVVSEQEGVRVHESAGGLGLDDAYVTFTIAVDDAHRSDPVVQELMRSGIRVLLGRIRSTPG